MSIDTNIPTGFLKYKSMELSPKTLKFLGKKHNTKVGTWGLITLTTGQADFEFLDENNQLKATVTLKNNKPFAVPPAVWHRLAVKTDKLEGTVDFYCHPIYYFHKKYQLTKPHGDVILLNERYLKTLFESTRNLDIFDMGCGRGRNSLYLAQQGHKLISADIDEKQIAVLAEILKKEEIKNVQVKVLDLEQMQITNHFDVILLNVVLQFLNKEKVWDIISVAQDITRSGGLHSIVCPVETPGIEWPDHFPFILKPDELRKFYLDHSWAILEYNEDFGHLHRLDENGLPIRGKFASMVAQKS